MTAAMRKKIDCCRDCTKRHTGCHASCEDYKREKSELDELRSAMQAQKDSDTLYASYHIDSKAKRMSTLNLHTRRGGKKK